MVGHPGAARAVGTALARLPRHLVRTVPWQRVINANGRISRRADFSRPDLQRRILEEEGVSFRSGGRIELRRYLWNGPDPFRVRE